MSAPLDPIADQAPEDAIDGFLDREMEASFQAIKRRWGWDIAVDKLARMLLKEAHWRTIDG